MRFEKSARFAWRASASPALPIPALALRARACEHARPPAKAIRLADPLSRRGTSSFPCLTHRGRQPHQHHHASAGGSDRIRRSDDWPVGFDVFCGNAARHAENTRHSSPGRPHQGLDSLRGDRDRGDRHHAGLGGARNPAGFARVARLRVLGNLRGHGILDPRQGEQYQSRRALRRLSNRQFRRLGEWSVAAARARPQRFRSVHDRRILVCARHSPARDDPRRCARGAAQREPAAVAAPRSLPDFGRCGVGGRRCRRRGFRARADLRAGHRRQTLRGAAVHSRRRVRLGGGRLSRGLALGSQIGGL